MSFAFQSSHTDPSQMYSESNLGVCLQTPTHYYGHQVVKAFAQSTIQHQRTHEEIN